jgi:oligopeptide transport system permease protein
MTDTHIAPEMWAPAARDGAAAEYIAAPSLTFWQDVRKRLWANKPAMLGLGFIILLVLAAIFGPLLSRHTYFEQNLKLSNIPPLFQTYAVTDGAG